jgi:hypothetical protein
MYPVFSYPSLSQPMFHFHTLQLYINFLFCLPVRIVFISYQQTVGRKL